MAGKSTISITFKLDGDSKSFKDLANDAEGLKKVISSTLSEAQQLKGNVINFAALATGIDAAQRSFNQLQAGMKDLTDAYAVQESNERQLAVTMRNSMGASDDQIDSIKKLCSAQQELGVIGDEVQLAGAQELATYLGLTSSLETLIPVLNDMNAQQYGLNATCESSVTIATMLGKVMNGQVGALSRYGYTFDEVQEKILKYGTEEERAAVLAEVVSASVGGMNAELAKTDSGKQQQLVNALGDMKEELGAMVQGALPFVTIAAQSATALTSVSTLVAGIKTLSTTLYTSVKAFTASTVAMIKNKGAALATAAAQKIVSAATTAWTAVQKVLNMVLTMNPIGLVITAIGALVTALIAAYNNCEGFREIVDKVWEAIKPLANAIMNGLAKAFEWLVEKCKEAWAWLKNILGLGGKKVDVAVEVSKSEKGPDIDLGETYKKYENYKPEAKGGSGGAAKAGTTPVLNDNASNLKEYNDNIKALQEQLQTVSADEAAGLNQQIAMWQKKADAIENAGKTAEDMADLPINEEAANLKDIGDNIDILTARLQKASATEATLINQQIAKWEEKADAIKNAGKVTEQAVNKADLPLNKNAATLKDIGDNIDILTAKLQTATVSQAALINQQIKAWNDKADAIKNAGKEAEKTSLSTGKAINEGWGGIKNIGSSIEGLTDSLKGNGNAWQTIVGFVDSFIGLYQGFQTVIQIIGELTGITNMLAAAKQSEAIATTTATTAAVTGAAEEMAASTALAATKGAETTMNVAAAASGAMAAHSSIPFVGIALGLAAVGAIIAAMATLPKFADGGVVSGPTLAMVGEYAGASGNPEVIAPLDKLRGMLADNSGGVDFGKVRFEIEGRTLVGIMNKENNRIKRS